MRRKPQPAPSPLAQKHASFIQASESSQGRRGTKTSGICLRAWRALRELTSKNNNFTIGDLLDIVATGQEKAAYDSVYAYITLLARHGVLGRRTKRDYTNGTPGVGRGEIVWRLQNDPGWHAPVWRKTEKVLWNPNTKTIIARQEVAA